MRSNRFTRVVVGIALLIPAVPVGAAEQSCTLELSISEDTTWTKAESPYVLPCYVFVEPGVTLTVEPGVRAETTALWVAGALRAEGLETDPIVFGGVDGRRWRGIWISHARGFRPASAITNVRIENAEVGLRLDSDAFPVHDAVFRGNGIGLKVDNPETNVTFTGNEFYSNEIAFHGRTAGVIGVYENDFWDNEISLFFQAQSPWECQKDPGIFQVHYNDILRGPDAPWFSFDVRASDESGRSGMHLDASDNWWGTTNEDDITARMEPQIDCCPEPDRAGVSWREPAPLPQTATESPGPIGTPAQEPSGHGDPAYIATVRRPRDRDCLAHGSLDRIRGTVSGAVMPTPDRLNVALVRFTGACSFYDPETDRFERTGGCWRRRRTYFDVRVRDGRWHVSLPKPLRAGRYYFYAGDMPGADQVAFRVLSL